MKKVIRKSAKTKRGAFNTYGEKKKKSTGPIVGGPKRSEARVVDGFPVRGQRA